MPVFILDWNNSNDDKLLSLASSVLQSWTAL